MSAGRYLLCQSFPAILMTITKSHVISTKQRKETFVTLS